MALSLDRMILIVEDDRDIAETVADILDDRGYAVVLAANGREALNLIENGRETPALILLDLTMPVMDGWEFKRRLDARPGRSSELREPVGEIARALPAIVEPAAHVGGDQQQILGRERGISLPQKLGPESTWGTSGPRNLTDLGSNMVASSPAHGRKEATMPQESAPDYSALATRLTVEDQGVVCIIRRSA
jgi:CheY-like chemotaxis protein